MASDLDKELDSSVYDAPATRLKLIFDALRKAGFSKAQAESLVAELVPDEFCS